MAEKVTPLYSEQQVRVRIHALAREISEAMPADLMIVALLRGSFVFAADLIRALHACGARPQIDFMTLGSYGANRESSGVVTVYRDMSEEVAGRDVLIIDDILESGRTLSYAREQLLQRGAKSLHIAVLLEKPGKRVMPVEADFVGFVIPDSFVVGYGLDAANYYRELPFIGVLEKE